MSPFAAWLDTTWWPDVILYGTAAVFGLSWLWRLMAQWRERWRLRRAR